MNHILTTATPAEKAKAVKVLTDIGKKDNRLGGSISIFNPQSTLRK